MTEPSAKSITCKIGVVRSVYELTITAIVNHGQEYSTGNKIENL